MIFLFNGCNRLNPEGRSIHQDINRAVSQQRLWGDIVRSCLFCRGGEDRLERTLSQEPVTLTFTLICSLTLSAKISL
jgi:hypothetical protein